MLLREQDWGIEGYRIPKCNAAIERPLTWTFSKEKGKNFIQQIEKNSKGRLAPNAYKIPSKWQSILANMKGEERTTFIAKIFKTEGAKPSPCQYKIKDLKAEKDHLLGKVNKGPRMSTTWESEYLASATPGAKYIDIYTKVKKGSSMPDLKKGLAWRVKKKDGPDPGSYPGKEKAFNTIISRLSPSFRLGKGNRTFFTSTLAKRKNWVPGAGKYETINYDKIHRRLTSKRH